MTLERQDSPAPSAPSNSPIRRPWRLLGTACREAASAPAGRDTLRAILARAVEATGVERAFLVTSGPRREDRKPSVEALASHRPDGAHAPSRTVLARALAGRRFLVYHDAPRDPRLAEGNSVRSLELRFAASVPVAVPRPGCASLVLDSRLDPRARVGDLRDLSCGFAGLLGLVLAAGSPAPTAGAPPATPAAHPDLVGRSRVFRDLLKLVRRVAPLPLPVLVRGESGSGKEGVARLLHLESARSDGPFVAVNCAAIPESLLESELFGAVRGAYTGLERDRRGLFRLAHGGTLLLDEVGDMSPAMQAKLLRVVQEARLRPVGGDAEVPVDVRVVAATHRDLAAWAAEGRFRADLYYRLAVIELRTPPLRERREDIPLLVRHVGSKLARALACPEPRWSPAALERLDRHPWPGNVRELEAVVARAVVRAGDRRIETRHLDLPAASGGPRGRIPDNLEAAMIEAALRQAGGVVKHAAARVGWTRQKLYRRMLALGITDAASETGGEE